MLVDVRIRANVLFTLAADGRNQWWIRGKVHNNGPRIFLQIIVKILFLNPSTGLDINLINVLGVLGTPASIIHLNFRCKIRHSITPFHALVHNARLGGGGSSFYIEQTKEKSEPNQGVTFV
jgi:hypothetical protein